MAKRAYPEAQLQTKIKQFVREFCAVPHLFAAHDRGANPSAFGHKFQKARGQTAGWPDVEIALEGGATFRCELKAKGKKVDDDGEQMRVGKALIALGHPWAWADSVVGFFEAARIAGVPFRPGALLRALDLDLVLAGAAMKRKGAAPKSYRPAKPRAKPARKGGITTARLVGL